MISIYDELIILREKNIEEMFFSLFFFLIFEAIWNFSEDFSPTFFFSQLYTLDASSAGTRYGRFITDVNQVHATRTLSRAFGGSLMQEF